MNKKLKKILYEMIFKSDTNSGKAFDIVLILAIVLSVAVIMLDSIAKLKMSYGDIFNKVEWFFTILFTIEYILRIYSSENRWKYIFSFFGLIDLISIIPSYLGILVVNSHYLLSIRVIRIIRIFRILKLSKYIEEANYLTKALLLGQRKILVFSSSILILITILGSVIYLVEGPENGFTSIPVSMYWSIVTLTTVGYGDISPKTPLGQFISSLVMFLGYSIIAIPTGIVTVSISEAMRDKRELLCQECGQKNDNNAFYCNHCGNKLS